MADTATFLLIEDDPDDIYLIERAFFKEAPPTGPVYITSATAMRPSAIWTGKVIMPIEINIHYLLIDLKLSGLAASIS